VPEVAVYWHDVQWWAWIPMSIFMLFVWGLVVWAVVRLVTGPQRDREPRPPDSLEILDGRLARGEIDPPEYWERRAILEGRDKGTARTPGSDS
jgi:putative membrane protein